MRLNLALQIELGDAPQILAQDFFLDLKLMLIARMLIMAPAATREIRAAGEDSLRRSLDDLVYSRAREARFLFDEHRLDFFFRENKRHEYSLPASALIGRQTRQSIATVDQLFDCEEQELILRH